MKIAVAIGTSMLGLALGTTAFANTQHGHEDGRKAGAQKQQGNEHQKEPGRSSAQQQHSDRHQANGPEQRHEQRPHEQPRAHENNRERQQPHYQRANGPEHMREASRHEEQHFKHREVWEGHRAQNWQHEHHSWRERGGYRGYRIPEDRFHAHFGRGHWFHMHSAPILVVGGFPRFQYGGFWFSVVDPWPGSWSHNWYETDDVYVDYVGDGYYMFNRRHPGVAIAVNVSM